MTYQNLQTITNPIVFQIHIDLSTLNLFLAVPTLCPFVKERNIVAKAQVALYHIVNAVSIENRVESLVHTFYLGALKASSTRKQLLEIRRVCGWSEWKGRDVDPIQRKTSLTKSDKQAVVV
ncbi:1946_t:CDS:2 [Gigaspora margarita]|uniref:1946_t:CDS:1 n=1 Tax=Gigaspora margarita TaxID=4874 RepID=A0ABM8W4G8_GIGMA|nr:1946_t:CDS:2 [Gigaspora margarita]